MWMVELVTCVWPIFDTKEWVLGPLCLVPLDEGYEVWRRVFFFSFVFLFDLELHS